MEGAIKLTDKASPALAKLAKLANNPQGLLAVLQRSLSNDLKAYYRDKNAAEPNKLGGSRTNFWAHVGDSVFPGPVGKKQAAVSIGHEAIAQKANGGVILAKRRKFLAIPVAAESHGHSPREAQFQGRLFFRKFRKGGTPGGWLCDKQTKEPLFLLKIEVVQKPAPGAVPDGDKEKAMADRLVNVAKDFIAFEQLED